MENSKHVLNKIISNLFRNYIFYFPKQFYPNIEPTFLSDIIRPDMVNTIYYFDFNKELHKNPSVIHGLDIFNKGNQLDNNTNDLITLKQNLTLEEFYHIFEKYGQYVGTHCIMTQWMYANIKIDMPLTTSKVESMFQFQAKAFDEHADKLESYFGEETITSEVDDNQVLEIVSETLEELPAIEIKKEVEIPTKPQKKEAPLKAKQKEPLMTDEKARKYILETVFGIDPEFLDAEF
ncbi:hypothetical protein [Hanstruepera ponticola]|uniref:hypothetical protein n=1 Tax=Hanstruepera ponticola TaxID=2042995 RepID=UPI00177C3A68|nr:hypothetical protein [Hanstruepera ponticola]